MTTDTFESNEPTRFIELRTEKHIFQKKLSEKEKSEHHDRYRDLEMKISQLKDEASEEKTFITSELAGSEPIRVRAQDREAARRTALLGCERKRAELMRDFHLDAACDGYIWIDVECRIVADDVECEVEMIRNDSDERVWKRTMNEHELKARKARHQLELKNTNAPGGRA